jgi:hypothetical protein
MQAERERVAEARLKSQHLVQAARAILSIASSFKG